MRAKPRSLTHTILVTALLGIILSSCGNGVEGGVRTTTTEPGQTIRVAFSIAHRGTGCVYQRKEGAATLLFQATEQNPDNPGTEVVRLVLDEAHTEIVEGRVIEGRGMPETIYVGKMNGSEVSCGIPEVYLLSGEKLACATSILDQSASIRCEEVDT